MYISFIDCEFRNIQSDMIQFNLGKLSLGHCHRQQR